MASDDSELVARLLQGDEHAYAALMARHLPWAGRVVATQLHGAAQEPVLTTTFHRAWRELGQLPPHRPFARWLLALLQRETAMYGRRHPELRLVEPPLDLDEWMEPEQQRLAAFLQLSEEQRLVMALIQEACLSYEFAAEILACSRSQFERRLLAARRAYYQALQQRREACLP